MALALDPLIVLQESLRCAAIGRLTEGWIYISLCNPALYIISLVVQVHGANGWREMGGERGGWSEEE